MDKRVRGKAVTRAGPSHETWKLREEWNPKSCPAIRVWRVTEQGKQLMESLGKGGFILEDNGGTTEKSLETCLKTACSKCKLYYYLGAVRSTGQEMITIEKIVYC